MTVAELIPLLQQMNPATKVYTGRLRKTGSGTVSVYLPGPRAPRLLNSAERLQRAIYGSR